MTALSLTGAVPAVLGKLLGIAFASGVNLYATIAVLGVGVRLGWITGLPPTLHGLQSSWVVAAAAVLYLIEFVADKIPHIDPVWDAIHTIIRPAAAALLAVGALAELPWTLRLAGAAGAGAVALTAHGAKAGLRMTLHTAPTRKAAGLVSLAEDAVAVLLVLLALLWPIGALAFAAAALLSMALFARPIWRAFILGLRAVSARLQGFFRAGWHEPRVLPAALRDLIDSPGVADAPPRVARAALKGVRQVGDYRSGWLVLTSGVPAFLYRSLFRPRRIALPPMRSIRTRPSAWADVVEVESADGTYEIFLLKDGPTPELAAVDLVPVVR